MEKSARYSGYQNLIIYTPWTSILTNRIFTCFLIENFSKWSRVICIKACLAKIISLKPQEKSFTQKKAGDKVYKKLFFDVDVQVYSYHHLGQFISNLENCQSIFFVIEAINLKGSYSISRIQEGIRPENLYAQLIVSNLFFQK